MEEAGGLSRSLVILNRNKKSALECVLTPTRADFFVWLYFSIQRDTAQAGVGVACAVWGCIKRESSVIRGDLRLLSSLQGKVRQSVEP